MAGPIPKSFIDDLLGRVDIVDVIDADVPLKKTGRDYQALCPFHNEKTPSFTVSQEKQFYHCFGCGAHGSAIGFLMNYRNLEFVDAIEELAARLGLEVPRERGRPGVETDHQALYAVMAQAQRYYARQLKENPERNRAVDYLRRRGLSGVVAKAYGIGFAPPGWDNLRRALADDHKALERAGLVVTRDDERGYDRFRDRIMFPIQDRRGRVVAFGGRVIDDSEPKYLNSPETPIFQKRRELYGLYQAVQHGHNPDRLLVVEGYMDVLALTQHGITNVVATLGTATTSEHLEQLFRVAREVVFCFDGDAAGRRAAWRALETTLGALQAGRQAGFLFMPEGEDPDSLVRKQGPGRFSDRAAITPLSEFLLEGLGRKTDLTSRDGRARLIDIARPQISKVPPGAFRDLLIDELEKRAGVTLSGIAALRSARSPARGVSARPERGPARRADPLPLMTRALMLLLRKPALAGLVGDPGAIRELDEEDAILFAEVLDLIRGNPHMTPAAIVERWRGDAAYERLSGLLARPCEAPDDGLEAEFAGALARLGARSAKRRRPKLRGARPQDLSETEKAKLREIWPGKPGP